MQVTFSLKRTVLALVVGAVIGVTSQPVRAQTAAERLKRATEELKRNVEEARKKAEEAARKQPPPKTTAPAPSATQTSAAPDPSSQQPVTLSDLDKPQGPVQIAAWKTMPDVVGVHLHMPLQQAAALLKKEYAQSSFQPWPVKPLGNLAPAVTGGFSINYENRAYADQINVDVIQPPNPQIVWHARRIAQRQHINRATLLAALRDKYGKETVAASGAWEQTTDDRRIQLLHWLFDEQGKRVPLPSSGLNIVIRCAGPNVGAVTEGTAVDEDFLSPARAANPWCVSAYVGVLAYLSDSGDPEIIETVHVEMTSFPLAVRSAKITAAWKKAAIEKLRQQEIEKSKQAKPKL